MLYKERSQVIDQFKIKEQHLKPKFILKILKLFKII